MLNKYIENMNKNSYNVKNILHETDVKLMEELRTN
jgi:hypothetical protein